MPVRLLAVMLFLAPLAQAEDSALTELRLLAASQAASEAPEAPAPPPSGSPDPSVYFCALGPGGASVSGPLFSFRLSPVSVQSAGGAAVPILEDSSISLPARAKARALLDEMLAQSPQALKDSMKSGRVFLALIPKDKKLTDLPQFKSLRGVKLPDGRTWDDIRGVGFVSQTDGAVAVGAGEENFLPGEPDGYPKAFLLAHELSHAVHEYGLSRAEKRALASRFEARKGTGLPFPSQYAAGNPYEYFAVSGSAFFDRRLGGSDPEQDFPWLHTHDAAQAAALERAYGNPRALWSDGAPSHASIDGRPSSLTLR